MRIAFRLSERARVTVRVFRRRRLARRVQALRRPGARRVLFRAPARRATYSVELVARDRGQPVAARRDPGSPCRRLGGVNARRGIFVAPFEELSEPALVAELAAAPRRGAGTASSSGTTSSTAPPSARSPTRG